MVKKNSHIAKLKSGYLFPEINKRKLALLKEQPDAQFISLGIGDTTQPIPSTLIKGLVEATTKLGTVDGYRGYGGFAGYKKLRVNIKDRYYSEFANEDEIFISDGAKPALGRLSILFGSNTSVAIQDPAYPVYVDSSVVVGQTGEFNQQTKNYDNITYMSCLPENNFFPDLSKLPRTDLIYFCSPNNPTGTVATKEQLTQLVDFAKQNQSIILFDAAYSSFIQDPSLPRSIYEIEGARDVAIELGSFSKMAGFTGVRLGWVVVPDQLKFSDGSSVKKDWERISATFFNGASNIVQSGGCAALSDAGMEEMRQLITYYQENTKLLKQAIDNMGYPCYGGVHTPFLWVHYPEQKSWDVFETILRKTHVITSPGIGFGPAGEGFIRMSAFPTREELKEAITRFKRAFSAPV